MWQVHDKILINHAIEGDIIQWDDQVFELKELIDHDDYYIVRGIEVSWDDNVELKIADCSVIPLMIWQ